MENPTTNQQQYNEWANQLEELERAALARMKSNNESISYVRWIIDDLRRGDIATVRVNYAQQSDKYAAIPEIKDFLEKIGVVNEPKPWRPLAAHRRDGDWKKPRL